MLCLFSFPSFCEYISLELIMETYIIYYVFYCGQWNYCDKYSVRFLDEILLKHAAYQEIVNIRKQLRILCSFARMLYISFNLTNTTCGFVCSLYGGDETASAQWHDWRRMNCRSARKHNSRMKFIIQRGLMFMHRSKYSRKNAAAQF